jgi:hypothetical protein
VSFIGSPALLMIEGPRPGQWSSFSREFSIIPYRRTVVFIESVGELLFQIGITRSIITYGVPDARNAEWRPRNAERWNDAFLGGIIGEFIDSRAPL